MKFSNILFWCEFPREVNWDKVSTNLGKKKIKTYLAVSSPNEFKQYQKNLSKYKNIILEGAWPTISKKKGYWFSSFTDKKEINKFIRLQGDENKSRHRTSNT